MELTLQRVDQLGQVLRHIDPVIGFDVHGAEEKLGEYCHAWMVVEWDDTRRRQTEDDHLHARSTHTYIDHLLWNQHNNNHRHRAPYRELLELADGEVRNHRRSSGCTTSEVRHIRSKTNIRGIYTICKFGT